MRYFRRALKLIFPYGLVRAYQIVRGHAALNAQAEQATRAAAQAQVTLDAEARARAHAEAQAEEATRASAQARFAFEAEAAARAQTEAQAEEARRAAAQARASLEVEARARAHAEGRAEEADRAIQQMRTALEAETCASAHAEARAEAADRVAAEAKAALVAETRARVDAEARAEESGRAARAAVEQEARAIAHAKAEAAAEALREEERQIFTDNEVIYNGVRIFSRAEAPRTNLSIRGVNNTISLSETTGDGILHVQIQERIQGCTLEIGQRNRIAGNLVIDFYSGGGQDARDTRVSIGSDNIFNGTVHIASGIQPGTVVSIGSENLFADNIHIVGAVDHLVYDAKTKEKQNKEFGITLKDKIWICRDVLILNRSHVNSETIIAARAIVNKPFKQKNVMISGAPAKVSKRNVMWHRHLNDDYLSNPSPLLLDYAQRRTKSGDDEA